VKPVKAVFITGFSCSNWAFKVIYQHSAC